MGAALGTVGGIVVVVVGATVVVAAAVVVVAGAVVVGAVGHVTPGQSLSGVVNQACRGASPEGLEKNVDTQAMADLIQFILTSE